MESKRIPTSKMGCMDGDREFYNFVLCFPFSVTPSFHLACAQLR